MALIAINGIFLVVGKALIAINGISDFREKALHANNTYFSMRK